MMLCSIRIGSGTLFWPIFFSVCLVAAGGCVDDARDPGLSSAEIGDAARGAQIFDEKFCSDCHAYAEVGGKDAPPLDYMRGRLTAADVANMAGALWNHLPGMLDHFEAEGIQVPTFSENEMADLIAFLHGGGSRDTSPSMAPPGHVGGHDITVAEIGDASAGELVFEEKGCIDCHAYSGTGGDDAPPLDYMAGHMSVTEIANMSGTIWNHLPGMIPHYEAEGMSVPRFSDEEMADLVAYLHGGSG